MRRGGTPLLGITAAVAGMTSGPALSAEWTFVPDAQLTTQAQDNPRLLPEGDERVTSFVTRAGLRTSRRTERLDLAARAAASIQRSDEDSGLDRDEQLLDLTAGWKGERLSWRGNAVAARDTTLTSELGVTGLTQLNQRHEGYNVSLGPAWQASERLLIASSAGWQLSRYPDPETTLRDYRYGTVGVSAVYALSDRASLSLVGSTGRYSTESAVRDTRNASVSLEAQYAWSERWIVSVGAGPSWVEAGRSSEHGYVYNFSLARRMERGALSVSASRQQSPSGFGLLTEADEAGLDFTLQVSERLTGSATAGFVRRKDALPELRLNLQELRYRHAGLHLNWTLNPHWQLSGGLSHKRQKVGTFAASRSARNYEIQLALGWTGSPHVH